MERPSYQGKAARRMEQQGQHLGEKIRAARRQLKMTQAELAGNDFTKSFVSQVEKGFARPSIRSLKIMARRLNKPVGYFLNDEEATPTGTTAVKGEHLLQSARSFVRDQHWQDALAIYRDVLDATPKGEAVVRARALTEMSQVLWQLNRKQEAVAALEESIELYRHIHDPFTRIKAINRLAEHMQEMGDRARAVALYEQALTVLDEYQVDDEAMELKLHTDVGLHLARLNQPERAKRHLRMAMGLASKLDDYYRWGEICHAMGFLCAAEGELDKARDYSLRAVSFYNSVQDAGRKLQARVNAASASHRAGEVQEAWKQATLALEEAESLGEPAILADVHRLHGRLAEREEKWEQAVAAYERSLEYEKDPDGLISLHRRRARCLHRAGRIDDAVEAARQAIALLEERADAPRDRLTQVYSELAFILMDAGALDEARKLSMKSMELFH